MRRFLDAKEGRTEPNLYQKDSTQSNKFIFGITPKHIISYMKIRTYGDAEADIETSCPTFCWYETLQAIKKGISSFHPEKFTNWNICDGTGNPTKSMVVREFMKKVEESRRSRDCGTRTRITRTWSICQTRIQTNVRMLEANDDEGEERLFTSSIFRM